MQHANSRWSYLFRLLYLIGQLWPTSKASYLEDNYPASVIEDAHLTTLQLLSKYKYPGELHIVTTEDKYVLQVHRIARPGAKPVLLVHGLEDSSASWIIMGPHSGLGYYLFDAGYDVWMGNARGNRYSRAHVKLNPDTDKAFWSFSWHEIGVYDLPAMIDTVLNKTGYKKLSYFGHSQGTTTFFVMASSRPEYNSKVHVMNALAPAVFMEHVKTPLSGMAINLLKVIGDQYELTRHSYLFYNQCTRSAEAMRLCLFFAWKVIGKNVAELNMTMVPVIFGHFPAGANSKQGQHYLQVLQSNRFCAYNYCTTENQRIYGRATPPDYPLEKITAPVALYDDQNDYLSTVDDVKRLMKRLPNVVLKYKINTKSNPIEMIWGIHLRSWIQPQILQLLQIWEAGGPQNRTNVTTEFTEQTSHTTQTENPFTDNTAQTDATTDI
ncbi:GH23720 [Drosophila grimshawi]|uniref:Lipase n=1 Tax=Drosophila grimshawi TaxID=7222 RepID=B4K2L4_DROGR|nr:GH23720 [Drosophila grimshawi]